MSGCGAALPTGHASNERAILHTMSPEIAGQISDTIRSAARFAAKDANRACAVSFILTPSLEGGEEGEGVRGGLMPMVRHPGGELVRVHFYGDGCLPFVLDDFDQFKRALLPTIEGVGDVSLKETPEGFKVFLADNGDGLVCGAAVRERPAEATRVIRDMEERDAPGKITYVDQWGRLWAP